MQTITKGAETETAREGDRCYFLVRLDPFPFHTASRLKIFRNETCVNFAKRHIERVLDVIVHAMLLSRCPAHEACDESFHGG